MDFVIILKVLTLVAVIALIFLSNDKSSRQLPKDHPNRDNPDYIVAACNFCNTADNRYFDLAEKRGLKFDGLTPDELVAQRLPYVLATREKYREFWRENVAKSFSVSF